MPYTIRKSKNKKDPRPWKIVRKDTGVVVGTSKTRKDAIGSIAHRMDAEKRKVRRRKKRTRRKS